MIALVVLVAIIALWGWFNEFDRRLEEQRSALKWQLAAIDAEQDASDARIDRDKARHQAQAMERLHATRLASVSDLPFGTGRGAVPNGTNPPG